MCSKNSHASENDKEEWKTENKTTTMAYPTPTTSLHSIKEHLDLGLGHYAMNLNGWRNSRIIQNNKHKNQSISRQNSVRNKNHNVTAYSLSSMANMESTKRTDRYLQHTHMHYRLVPICSCCVMMRRYTQMADPNISYTNNKLSTVICLLGN